MTFSHYVWFEPHRRHCVVSLSKNINPSLVLVQPRKTRPFITERLLMGRKESNQTKQTKNSLCILSKSSSVDHNSFTTSKTAPDQNWFFCFICLITPSIHMF